MIVRPRENWLAMLLAWHGSVLPSILPQMALMLAVSLIALLGQGRLFGEQVPLDTAPFSLLGVSLAIFLAFRNNASYQRYLEARQHWGAILIACRALTAAILVYTPGTSSRRLHDANRIIAFAHLLRHQLRHSNPQADLDRLLGPGQAAQILARAYRPIALLLALRRDLETGARQQTSARLIFDKQLNTLGEAVGACERIANTPVPYPYAVLLHRTIYVYCFLLPFGLVHAIDAATPVIAVFVAYTLFALEAIAQDIGEPFGIAPNSLALEAICRTIERSVLDLVAAPLPPEVKVSADFRVN